MHEDDILAPALCSFNLAVFQMHASLNLNFACLKTELG
jgi:hypothetical protein